MHRLYAYDQALTDSVSLVSRFRNVLLVDNTLAVGQQVALLKRPN